MVLLITLMIKDQSEKSMVLLITLMIKDQSEGWKRNFALVCLDFQVITECI